jgi:4-hydroxy-4-methyl-2-oxoglutarate aldolase
MNLESYIVELIRKNRISTTEIADALGKTGSLPGVLPLNSLKYAVGKVRLIQPLNDSNYVLHEELEHVEPGEVVHIKPVNFSNVAVFGDLVAKYTLLYKQAAAIVVEGNVRDTARLVREQYPIWYTSSNPVGAVNFKTHSDEERITIGDAGCGGIAVCDEGGVVIIPASSIDSKLSQKLEHIEALEDLWHYCLNTLKWSTFDIVVKKRYLQDSEDIPASLLKSINSLGGQ